MHSLICGCSVVEAFFSIASGPSCQKWSHLESLHLLPLFFIPQLTVTSTPSLLVIWGHFNIYVGGRSDTLASQLFELSVFSDLYLHLPSATCTMAFFHHINGATLKKILIPSCYSWATTL